MNRPKVTAPDILRDARQIFLAHKKLASKQSKVENLEKLWATLESIREDGSKDYSLAEIGRRLEQMKGPRTQSLRNAQGAHYREIIAAYAKAINGSLKYVSKTKSSVDQAVDLIADPTIKAIIKAALDDAKHLKTRNDNLHAAFKLLNIGNLPIEIPTPSDELKGHANEIQSKILTPQLMIALKKGLNPTRLSEQRLIIAADGSIENEQGDRIFPPAFAFAIQAILSASE